MNTEEINKIVEEHGKWLADNSNGAKANLSRADLSDADLRGADLKYANLNGANLRGANLSRADLSYTDLSWTNLSDADLSHANLKYANLNPANLSDANLRFCTGNNREVRTIQTGKYIVVTHGAWLYIGCKKYLYTEWMEFTDDEIDAMDNGALEWWTVWKPILECINEIR